MPLEKTEVTAGSAMPIIRFKGTYNWHGLYRMIREWFETHKYDYNERRYKEKGLELEVDIDTEKKIDGIYMNQITMNIHDLGFAEKVVQKDGKTMKIIENGRPQIRIQAWLVIDYGDRFKGKGFVAKVSKWWMEISKMDIAFKYEDPLYYEVYDLHQKIKEYLGMLTKTNAF